MSNIRIHYKSEFEVTRTAITDEKNIFQIIVEQVGQWLKEHYSKTGEGANVFKRWLFRGGNLEVKDVCTEVTVTDYNEATRTAKYWTLRFEHNDENYAPRKWRVDVDLTCVDDDTAELAVTASWYLYKEPPGGEVIEPDSAVPRLVKRLLKQDGLACYKSGIKLTPYATQLHAGNERQFYELIISEERSIPVILINKHDYGEDVSPDGIQNLLAGSALVYWYDSAKVQSAINSEWGQGNVELYQCPADTIRIYQPHLDTQMEYDWERHPYFSLKEYTGRFQDLSRVLKQRILW